MLRERFPFGLLGWSSIERTVKQGVGSENTVGYLVSSAKTQVTPRVVYEEIPFEKFAGGPPEKTNDLCVVVRCPVNTQSTEQSLDGEKSE